MKLIINAGLTVCFFVGFSNNAFAELESNVESTDAEEARKVESSVKVTDSKDNSKEKTIKSPIKSPWSGSLEFGIIATTGNTSTRSSSGKAVLQYESGLWLNKTTLSFLRASDKDIVTAEQSVIRNYTKRTLIKLSYIFLSIHSDKDSFSGYVTRNTEVMGYGYTFIKRDNISWDIEIGAGAGQTERSDGVMDDDFISRIGTNFIWKMNQHSQISQNIFVEKGKDNQFTESTTSVKIKINDSLALSINFELKNNTNVPVDIKHTDTQTTVKIVYDF
jgi:putative salt-induced outer membrane protein YdiY